MQRIGVIGDAHANLPATRAALEALQPAGCDALVHVGDAVGIGPHPGEVVSLLVEREVQCVMGNHDEWAAFGLPQPLPPCMSEGEAAHQRWTRSQLTDSHRDILKAWPYELSLTCGAATVMFVHYARRADGGFGHLDANATADDFGRLYEDVGGDVVVFGHEHRPYDLVVRGRRLLNPGSAGCNDRAEARALLLTAADVDVDVDVAKLAVPYDDAALLRAFEDRQVPARDFILRTFIRPR